VSDLLELAVNGHGGARRWPDSSPGRNSVSVAIDIVNVTFS